jgi:hypothetical protein
VTESEISALLDAHDALVKAYVDSNLTFSEFVSAYGDFPRDSMLDSRSGAAGVPGVLQFFQKRIAFHLRVSSIFSGLRSADDPVDIPFGDAGRFLPTVGLTRLRELVARYPDFEAEPTIGS